jgi:hypothetical protein
MIRQELVPPQPVSEFSMSPVQTGCLQEIDVNGEPRRLSPQMRRNSEQHPTVEYFGSHASVHTLVTIVCMIYSNAQLSVHIFILAARTEGRTRIHEHVVCEVGNKCQGYRKIKARTQGRYSLCHALLGVQCEATL